MGASRYKTSGKTLSIRERSEGLSRGPVTNPENSPGCPLGEAFANKLLHVESSQGFRRFHFPFGSSAQACQTPWLYVRASLQ
jgi:hypothetical protein